MKKPKLSKDESANGLGVSALIMISRPKDEVEKRTFDMQIIVILGNSPFGRNC